MGRRNDSLFEDLLIISSKLPWAVSLLIALISYFVLHGYASSPPPTATSPGQMGAMAVGAMFRGIAALLQYLVPLLFVLGALTSFFTSMKRGALVRSVSDGTESDPLHNMTWREFEMLVGEAFRMRGFEVTETGGGGPDGGIDLRVMNNGETYLVQCKQWRSKNVPVSVVRELYGVMVDVSADGAYVVTSGMFTPDAKDFADRNRIRLISGVDLEKLISDGVAARSEITRKSTQPPRVQVGANSAQVPACPNCAGRMELRIAKRGESKGQQFWGCSSFPKCRGTRAA